MRAKLAIGVLPLLCCGLLPAAMVDLTTCAADLAATAARRAADQASAEAWVDALPPALRDGSLVAALP
jgi:hypothetical protein